MFLRSSGKLLFKNWFANDKFLNENKNTYLAGDFIFDLLHTENNETFNFFENMSSHMLPTITIPTKNTVIDNIFTNQIHPDMNNCYFGSFTIIFHYT